SDEESAIIREGGLAAGSGNLVVTVLQWNSEAVFEESRGGTTGGDQLVIMAEEHAAVAENIQQERAEGAGAEGAATYQFRGPLVVKAARTRPGIEFAPRFGDGDIQAEAIGRGDLKPRMPVEFIRGNLVAGPA